MNHGRELQEFLNHGGGGGGRGDVKAREANGMAVFVDYHEERVCKSAQTLIFVIYQV